MNLHSVIVLLFLMVTDINGDYKIMVRFNSYVNFRGHCSTCRSSPSEPLGCCDDISQTTGTCSGNTRCDTYLRICLNALGRPDRCIDTREIVTGINFNDGDINFNQGTFLGVPNPLELSGLSTSWTGATMLISAFDEDGSEDPLIDFFRIELSHATFRLDTTRTNQYRGRNNIAEFQMSIRVACSQNFGGPDCREEIEPQACSIFDGQECAGNGNCLNGVCQCNIGFIGESCEQNLNDCLSVTCSHGVCVDGINAFTCNCDSGFTGRLCDVPIIVDVCESVSCMAGTHCEAAATSANEQSTSTECVCDSNSTLTMCNSVTDESTDMLTTISTDTPITNVPTDDQDSELIFIIVGIGGGLLLVGLCIIILLIVICAVLKKRASQKAIAQTNSMATNPPLPDAVFNQRRGLRTMNSAVNLPLPSMPVAITSDPKEDHSDTDSYHYVYEHMYEYVRDS